MISLMPPTVSATEISLFWHRVGRDFQSSKCQLTSSYKSYLSQHLPLLNFVICDIYEMVNFMEAYCSSVEWNNTLTAFPVAPYGLNMCRRIGN